jgi:hypothetical protein
MAAESLFYIETQIPAGMTAQQYRRSRARAVSRRPRRRILAPWLHRTAGMPSSTS